MKKERKPYIQINLRMPEQLLQWVESKAQENMRTRHSEIMFMFETLKKQDEARK